MTDSAERGTDLAPAFAVTASTFALHLFVATRSGLWDRDEAFYSVAAVEMLRSGRRLVPTFGGQPWLEKPPLLFWLTSASAGVLGTTPLAFRLWSVVAAALTSLLVFRLGRDLVTPRAGFLAAAFCTVSPLMLLEGTAATMDALLLLLITAAMAAVHEALRGERRLAPALLFAAATGLAQLTKGPVGLAVPLGAAAIALLLLRRQSGARAGTAVLLLGAAAAGTLGYLAWALPADAASGGRLVADGLGVHVVGRALAPMERHGGGFLLSLPYYLPVVAFGFLPGTLFLPGGLSALLGGRLLPEPGRSLLLGWIASPLLLFTLVATKLPHYVLPAWPALALVAGGAVDRAIAASLPPSDAAWTRRAVGLYLPAAVAMAAGAGLVPFVLRIEALRAQGLLVSFLVLVLSAAAAWQHRKDRFGRSASIALGGSVVVAVVAAGLLLPVLDRTKPVPPLCAAIRRAVPDPSRRVPIAAYRFHEPSLVLHLGQPVEFLPDASAVERWSGREGPGILVLPREENLLAQPAGRPALHEIASSEGWNVSTGRRVSLVALLRSGTPDADGKR